MRRSLPKRRRSEHFLMIHLACAFAVLSQSCTRAPANQADSSGIVFLTSLGSPPANSIAWAPAEHEVLVTADEVGLGKTEVYIMDLTTRQKTSLLRADYGNVIASTWSPDRSYVLLVAHEHTIGNGRAGLWLLDTENKAQTYLSNSGLAAWSPDGTQIASFSTTDINTASERLTLSLIDPRNKEARPIYENSQMKYFFGLTWSPNGKALAFSLGEKEPGDLYLMTLPEMNARKLTKDARTSDAAWSPTGNLIAYTEWPSYGSDTRLHLVSSDGACDIQIPGIVHAWSPVWSPDGRELAYIGTDGIYIANLATVLGKDVDRNLCDSN